MTGTKAIATSEMRTFMENMTPMYTAIRKMVLISSSTWSAMNERTFSTSEVQRCTMSPVGFCTCQLYGRR